MICPVCKRDVSSVAARFAIKNICVEELLANERVDPGGRALVFPWGEVRLSDACDWCDLRTLINAVPPAKP